MNLVATIVCKDIRRLWPLAGFAILCVLLDQVLLAQGGWSPSSMKTPISAINLAFSALKWPAMLLFIVVLVHEDALVGERPFWRTRPVSKGTLAASKLLLFALVVPVPVAAARAYALLHLGVPPVRLCALVGESVVSVTSVAAFVALGASLTRNFVELALSALGLVAVIVVPTSALELLHPTKIPVPWDSSVQEAGPRILAFAATLLIGCVGLFIYHYISLKRRPTVIGLAVLLIVSIVVGNSWRAGTQDSPEATASEADWQTGSSRVHGSIQLKQPWLRADWKSSLWSEASVTVTGTKGGQEVQILSLEGTVPALSGEALHFSPQNFSSVWWRSEPDTLLWLGEPGLAKEARQSRTVEEQIRLDDREGLAAGMELRGNMRTIFRFAGYHDMVVFRLPLRTGATHTEAGQRWTVKTVAIATPLAVDDDEAGQTAAHIIINVTRPTSLLIPSSPFAHPWDIDPNFAILCRSSGTYTFSLAELGASHSEVSGLQVYNVGLRIVGVLHHGTKVPASALDPRWFEGAELVAFRPRKIGNAQESSSEPIDLVVQDDPMALIHP